MKVRNFTIKCRKCGHVWVPRIPDVRYCPNCKTAKFDMPQKEKGK